MTPELTSDFSPFGSQPYFCLLSLLFFSRGMDLLSTWVATPTLALEGNPLAKKLGWRLGALVNFAICFLFAFWPLSAVAVVTSSLLVAAHNFQSAWLMRTMGEDGYRRWFVDRLSRTPLPFYFICRLGEIMMMALIGGGLLLVSRSDSIAFSIGLGMLLYVVIVLLFTTLALVRMRRRFADEAVAASHGAQIVDD